MSDKGNSDSEKEEQKQGQKDEKFMSKHPQLQTHLNEGEYGKALKYLLPKQSKGGKQSMFIAVVTAYCLLKSRKIQECLDTLADFKAVKPQDSSTAKYLVSIYNNLGRYSETTAILEYVLSLFPNSKDLSEQLFFSYVREGKLLKQQNQALTLYKQHQQEIHAQWAVESMYLISLNLKFETKVLDIAYLLNLKLMKEPNFKYDKKFVLLHVKILRKQAKYKDAIDFIDRKQDLFENKLERQEIEADLYLQAKNYIVAINTYFSMLRINSHINQYTDMWKQYRDCIRIICDDFLPRQKKEFKLSPEIEKKVSITDANGESKGMNFDPLTVDAEELEILLNLIMSIKNMRKNIAIDQTSKRIKAIANEMQRTSYICDLEYKYVLALSYKDYPVHEESAFFSLLKEYIENFYNKFDVISDVRQYLNVLGPEESKALRLFARQKVDEAEQTYNPQGEDPPSMKLIRWRIVHFKIYRLLGTYSNLEKEDKLKLVNTIIQTYLWAHGNTENLSDIDKINLDDLIIISVELLFEINQYEWSVLNPMNFMAISILEYGLKKSPTNGSIRIWLMKFYGKLGLTSKFTSIGQNVKNLAEENFEKFGGLKYTYYQAFGVERELDATNTRYENYYTEALTKNKNALTNGFKNRDFEQLNNLLQNNDKLENSFFQNVVKMSKIHLDINRNATSSGSVNKVITKDIDFINTICEDDVVPTMAKQDVEIREFSPIKLGLPRDEIKINECLEASYNAQAAKEQAKRKKDRDRVVYKQNIRVFGYKHPKVVKFMCFLFRCLKDCIDQKSENLNLDMNSFLLLKNELSLSFLRKQDNIVATVKSAIKIYATQEEALRKDLEATELEVLKKILKSGETPPPSSTNVPEHQEGIGGFGNVTEPGTYEKIIAKLLEYNEKVNDGKEISVVEYLKRIDMDSPFIKTYEMQRHMKRAFYEEFKIHSLNYVLLLFESVMRMLTTIQKQMDDVGASDEKRGEKMQYYSKNYRRFIENRQKKIDKFIVNCIGWNHINRCIEVIDMALRDLLYKIIPTKVVIRELKTSSGKVLTRDSEYTLVEKKRYVTVGKKTHVDYIFELDLKEDTDKLTAQQEAKAAEEEKKRQNVFYLNFEDFSIVKLRSIVFMMYFPVNFTIAIINVWIKVLPNTNFAKSDAEDWTKEEIDGVTQAKHAIKDFVHSLMQHLKGLHDYIQGIIKDRPLQTNFSLIRSQQEFKDFKDVFANTKHTGLTPMVAEEFFIQTYEKLEESWVASLDQISKTMLGKINDIQMDIIKRL